MADTRLYENKYRKYLEDEADTYLKPGMRTEDKVIMGGLAAIGLGLGGYAALKSGAFKTLIHSTIAKAGEFRRNKVTAFNDAVRSWSQEEGLGELEKSVKSLFKGNVTEAVSSGVKWYNAMKGFKSHMDSSFREHEERIAKLMGSQFRDKDVQLKKMMAERNRLQQELFDETKDASLREKVSRLTDRHIVESHLADAKLQALKLKQTGFRFATVQDLIDSKEFSMGDDWIAEGLALSRSRTGSEDNFLNKIADYNILIDENNKFADVRDFAESFNGFVHSLSTDFTIPLVKINPLRMFYIDHFFSDVQKPVFHYFASDQKNPIVTGHNGSQDKPFAYIGGKVYDLMPSVDAKNLTEEGFEELSGNYFLADAQKGPIARLLRNMSGISISKFNTPDANAPFMKRMKYNLGSFFDVGFQDEPMGQVDLFDPTSWGMGIMNQFTKRLRQSEYIQREDFLSNAFGKNKDYILMRKHMSLEESGSYKEYLGQFTAGRENMENVTLSTLFPYGFFERLNATLNQVGLGLSNRALGSGAEIFGNLLLKRIAPIWAGMELWDYLNYESENLLGFQFEDKFAQMYKDTSIEIAKVRDNLGITDWAKGVAPLLVGGQEIAEMPILGNLLDWNDTAEETEDFWENGEVPIRKGRWWQLGNTPYIGGKVDHFEPNWIRRTLADVEFSDSKYGSREEYFANSWMPSLRHPFAPIQHFFTDPYHWEEKHYKDRPYMITGGISEIENMPLIGPLLNATLGQLLKPQRMMHEEYWTGETPEGQTPLRPPTYTEMQTVPISPDSVQIAMDNDGNVAMAQASVPIYTQQAGYGGTVESSVPEEDEGDLYSYVTAGGSSTLLRGDVEATIDDALGVMDTKSPQSTGKFKVERMFSGEGEPQSAAPLETPIEMHQMLGNLHYNVSEMGGFYGFMGASVTGEVGDQNPILQPSSDITSYTRAFWDLDIGGFGGDANEIFRRFLPADRKLNEINPIDNMMPTWLPGNGYFIDFQTGDPYTKVKRGEYRLPGEGYERLYNIDSEKLDKMDMGASFIGYDEETIRTHMLKGDAYKDEAFMQILNKGTKWHKGWEREMNQKGIAIEMEQYVEDKEANIGGFFDVLGDHQKLMDWMRDNAVDFKFYQKIDNPQQMQDMVQNGLSPSEDMKGFYAEPVNPLTWDPESQEQFFNWMVAQSPTALIDPKTRGTKSWESDEMHFENVQQVNFYATQKGTPINYLIHVDRQNPEKGIKVFAFEQSDALLEYTKTKVEGVRQGIRQDIDSGKIGRGDLYEIIDRFRILADVAPYSQEFRDLKGQLSNMNLSEEEMDEVAQIKKQVSERKRNQRFYNYRFKTANIDNEMVTVDHVIDNNTFVSLEHPDNPIKLAGLRVSVAKDNPIADEAARVIGQTIHEGARIRISYDADEHNRVKDDTYKSIQAVVYTQKGTNLNKYLIDQELAKEKENDYSPAAVHARFTQREINFGAMWEGFAHLDTILHTKFLQVRSPLESYERREVYGKDWQEWTDPIDDFLIPAIQNSAVHHPVLAIAGGGIIGMAFGSLKATDIGVDGVRGVGRYGKIVGGFIGASVMGIAVLNKMLQEHMTGKAWIPERRQKERATEEYFDILEYIKYNSLFDKYAKQALKVEGFDINRYLKTNEAQGEDRKKQREELSELKRKLYVGRPNQINDVLSQLRGKYQMEAKDKNSAMKEINKKLTELQNARSIQEVTPLAAKALQYYQASKQTMYGYESGDPISNILAGLPKKDRDYLVPFINAPEEERKRILDVVPNYMKRVLQSAWGEPVDEKMPLQTYFSQRPLPGANWKGWREDVSLDDIKVKFVDQVGLDPSEFDIWDDDIKRAQQLNVPTPNVFEGRESADQYARKLQEILTGFNVQGLTVDIVQSNKKGVHVDMDIEHDRRDDVQRLINREGHNVI